MDPILYLTYLHNGTGQDFFLSALSLIATLSFLGPFLLMLQNRQTTERSTGLQKYLFFSYRQALVTDKATASNPAPKPS